MRFQPKSRASMDHKPGPNIARAAAAVPNSSHTHLSPGTVSIFQISSCQFALQPPTKADAAKAETAITPLSDKEAQIA